MAEKKKMSVAEILAAARKADGKESSGGQPEAAPASDAAASSPAPAAKKPAATAPKPGGKMSTADILAAARAAKAGSEPAATPAAEKPAPAPKPAPKAPPAEKAAPIATAEKDTASILAAARAGTKPGPMSKAEAAVIAKSPAHMPGAAAEPKAKKTAIIVPPMPAKPAYAQKKPAKAAEEETRRGFISVMFGSFLGIGFTALGAVTGLWTLGVARFMFPNILTEPPSTFKVGFPADFPPGAVSEKFKAQFGVWVVNGDYNGQSQIYALKTVCTHLGCTPNWLEAEQKFKCPCHGSGFYKDGINFEGPAPRPLERYAIRVADDGQIEIDKSKTFQEEMGAWSDPSSFVPV